MSDRHASLYLVSRVAAAALNLVSVALFTRLAPTEVFGHYLVGFATSFIVFGTAFQWLLYAHFGVYTPARAARLAGALTVLLGVSSSHHWSFWPAPSRSALSTSPKASASPRSL